MMDLHTNNVVLTPRVCSPRRAWDRDIVLSWEVHGSVQSQKSVHAYLKSKQLLPFGFADQFGRSLNIPPQVAR